jgi:diaminohydroxyphosphoribosylaminopyrimidine deaminase/5-amino-6-(5-phosphoribosylamino)uracil reductase
MKSALGLAARGLGDVWPNPAVGCVVVKSGRVVGRGHTQAGGRPHAEAVALAQAGAGARDGVAYVTLEPCAHHGETPPCADALAAAGVARVVIAAGDPDPRTNGRGVALLRDAGIDVIEGVLDAEAAALNAGFFLKVRENRPLVTLKLATTLDGKIATAGGESQWITGPQARARGHLLRATHDAIMIGAGTALADDPSLTCRLPGLQRLSPVRVVLDTKARLPLDSQLARSAGEVPLWLVTKRGAKADKLAAAGADIMALGKAGDPAAVLAALASRGITRVLIEGGASVATSFIAAGLVDRIAWFRAPLLSGDDGLAGIFSLDIEKIDELKRFQRTSIEIVGQDLLESYAYRR